MRTVVVTGGTDGIGHSLTGMLLDRDDRVVVVGRDSGRGHALAAEARSTGAEDRFEFVKADLSDLSENRRVLDVLGKHHPKIDALVLCARHFLSHRRETADGLEATFALFYLSRYLFSHGLLSQLERSAERPVIVNVAGPGVDAGPLRWDDLQLVDHYDGLHAQGRCGQLNDLLGASFADSAESRRTRYVLVNPGPTSTGFSGEYDDMVRLHIEALQRSAKPATEAAAQILKIMDAPPPEPLSAFMEGTRLDLTGYPTFNAEPARELAERSRALLSAAGYRGPRVPAR